MLLKTGNAKLKRDGIYSFSLPAYKSACGKIICIGAKDCIEGCYARTGFFKMSSVQKSYENNLTQTESKYFVGLVSRECIVKKIKLVRIHASGDFYSLAYLKKWIEIAQLCPNTHFYAYTKALPLFKKVELPFNLTIIFSEGGKYDALIDRSKDRHARVFPSLSALKRSGYANTTKNDINAIGKNNRIGLVYHGGKNKAWSTVQ